MFHHFCAVIVVCALNRKQVEASKKEADKDGVKVPTTLEEYCVKTVVKSPMEEPETFDMYDDDYYEMSDEEDNLEEAEGCVAGCSAAAARPNDSGLFDDSEGDSGQGEN